MKLGAVLAVAAAVFMAGTAQAYQVLPDPFAVNSTDQSIFYWTGSSGPVAGIADAAFAGPTAPGLGDTQWEITAPAGGITLDFLQVYSAISGSDYQLRDNGNIVPWSNIDQASGFYSYNNLLSYFLSPGAHIFTVDIIDSSGTYCCSEGPLGDDQYNWATITFNTDPNVAPAVRLPPGLVLLGGLMLAGGWRMRRLASH